MKIRVSKKKKEKQNGFLISVGELSTTVVIFSKQILQIEHQQQEMFAFLQPVAHLWTQNKQNGLK